MRGKKEVRFGIAGIQSSNNPDLLIKLSVRAKPILLRVPSMDALEEGFSSGVLPKQNAASLLGVFPEGAFLLNRMKNH
jgi:hypothetical protein